MTVESQVIRAKMLKTAHPRSRLSQIMASRIGGLASEVVCGTPGSTNSFTDRGLQRVGDSNRDALVSISDAISIVHRLFGDGKLSLPCEGEMLAGGNLAVLDVNSDEAVDLSDVIYLLDYMFLGGAAPPAGTDCILLPDCTDR